MIQVIQTYKRQFAALIFITVAASLLPVADVYHAVGDGWRGVPPAYSDEEYYYARVNEVKDGNIFIGNPYFYEHRNDQAPTFFVSDWLAAIPLVLGASLSATLFINFSLWSLIFVFLAFILFLELRLPKNFAALGAFFIYIQSYVWILRPVSLQQIFPFFLIFILAALRWYRTSEKRSSKIFLAIAAAAPFYLYAYLWQIVVSAFLVLVVVLLWRRDWQHFRHLALPLAGAAVLALPAVLYTIAQLHNSYFWQTAERITLVYTHLPTAEVLYSGGWVVLTLAVFFLMKKKAGVDLPALVVLSIIGTALLGVQASNIVTGKEMETAVHVKHFIIPWLGISLGMILVWLAACIPDFAKLKNVRWGGLLMMIVALSIANVYQLKDFPDFFTSTSRDTRNQKLQMLAAPFQYLDTTEKDPVVVWVTDSESDFAYYLPALTKHYVLYTHPGMWHLVSNDEIKERYLASNYLHEVTKESLIADLGEYAGPAAAWHRANTVNRGARLCELLQLEKVGYSCGKVTTTEELLGDAYFNDFLTDNVNVVRPHIREILARYHVSYVASSAPLPLILQSLWGAKLVYDDQRYRIYHLDLTSLN